METFLQPNYVISVQNGQFTCEVILPESSPLRSVIGRSAPRKLTAKKSAAFEACLMLRKGKYLDANLLPIYEKHLPAMRNAQLALHLKNTGSYEMRTKPSIWASSVGTVPLELYVTVLNIEQPQQDNITCRSLAILTRSALPSFPRFPIYLNCGSKSQVLCTSSKHGLQVTKSEIEAINIFTLRIFSDIFNKVYEPDAARMPYWLAPVSEGAPNLEEVLSRSLIDWDIVQCVQSQESLPWDQDTPDSFFANRFLVDPLDGGRRYFTVGVHPSLKPLDPVPPDACTRRFMENILDYSTSLFKSSRARVTFKAEQPVIVAHRVVHRRNWLDEITEKEKYVTTKCYVCPEPLRISTVSVTCYIAGKG